jgi:hypothetical protein
MATIWVFAKNIEAVLDERFNIPGVPAESVV